MPYALVKVRFNGDRLPKEAEGCFIRELKIPKGQEVVIPAGTLALLIPDELDPEDVTPEFPAAEGMKVEFDLARPGGA